MENEEYGFLHDRKTLKVSGILEVDGVEIAYTRYANKPPGAQFGQAVEEIVDPICASSTVSDREVMTK